MKGKSMKWGKIFTSHAVDKGLISKIYKRLRAGGIIQEIESLPSKFKALSSNPSTIKTKTNYIRS
jgi:hypothetical protein